MGKIAYNPSVKSVHLEQNKIIKCKDYNILQGLYNSMTVDPV